MTVVRRTHVYTAILLTGLTPTTCPDAFTHILIIPLDTTGDTEVRRVNRSHDVFAIHESISSLSLGAVSHIPTPVPESNI